MHKNTLLSKVEEEFRGIIRRQSLGLTNLSTKSKQKGISDRPFGIFLNSLMSQSLFLDFRSYLNFSPSYQEVETGKSLNKTDKEIERSRKWKEGLKNLVEQLWMFLRRS